MPTFTNFKDTKNKGYCRANFVVLGRN